MRNRTKICFVSAGVASLGFLISQIAILTNIWHASYQLTVFSTSCFLLHMPFSFVVIYDVYHRFKHEKKVVEDKMRAINASNMVVTFDAKGSILTANKRFCSTLGYSELDLIGEHHDIFCSEKFTSFLSKTFWERLRSGSDIEGLYQRLTKSGEPVWLRETYSPIKNGRGEVYQVIKIAVDVTAHKILETDILRKNKYLEHAAKILRHDMHSGINTYLPRGLRSLERRLSPETIKELNIESPLKLLKEGLTHTQRVYEGVKEFTNLVKEDAELVVEEANLTDILKEYFCSTAYVDQVAIDWLPTIEVNKPLFCTAIDNMVRNGLKYNDSKFKMVAIKMEDDEHLSIIDNGRGLSQKEFERLSQPYVRKDGQAESGTGLGLSITVAILNEHGFPVTVDKLEEGTKIKVKIR